MLTSRLLAKARALCLDAGAAPAASTTYSSAGPFVTRGRQGPHDPGPVEGVRWVGDGGEVGIDRRGAGGVQLRTTTKSLLARPKGAERGRRGPATEPGAFTWGRPRGRVKFARECNPRPCSKFFFWGREAREARSRKSDTLECAPFAEKSGDERSVPASNTDGPATCRCRFREAVNPRPAPGVVALMSDVVGEGPTPH